MHREIAELREIIKANGELQLMVASPGKKTSKPLNMTLHELIEFIQVTGQCPGRHLTYSERQELVDE